VEDLVATNTFWIDRRVFITGHTGFKGSWLCVLLKSLGAEICGYSLPPPTDPNLYTLANITNGINSIVGDVRDLNSLKNAISNFKPDTVIHMAAQSLVKESYYNPVATYETNVLGTVNLLESVRHTDGIQSVINVTSDKSYLNKELDRGYREGDELGGHDPYSNSKACSELVTSAYRDSFFSPISNNTTAIASVRAGNVIGGGDWASDRLVPDIVRCYIKNQPAVIRNPDAIRPWQHVLEPLSGYLLLAEKLVTTPELSGVWNFGPEFTSTKPVSWIADELTQRWGNNAHWTKDDKDHPQETHTLHLDSSKARNYLEWGSRLDLDQAIDWTLGWYMAYSRKESMQQFTESQIQQYLKIE
jgi:CDP-glucose 4,6-dehydratase